MSTACGWSGFVRVNRGAIAVIWLSESAVATAWIPPNSTLMRLFTCGRNPPPLIVTTSPPSVEPGLVLFAGVATRVMNRRGSLPHAVPCPVAT